MLHYSEGDLVRRTGLLLGEVRALIQLGSEALLPGPALCPALDLYVREKELPHWGRHRSRQAIIILKALVLFWDLPSALA